MMRSPGVFRGLDAVAMAAKQRRELNASTESAACLVSIPLHFSCHVMVFNFKGNVNLAQTAP